MHLDLFYRHVPRLGERTDEYAIQEAVRRHVADPVHYPRDSQHHLMDSSAESKDRANQYRRERRPRP